jgi:hypothetical protein
MEWFWIVIAANAAALLFGVALCALFDKLDQRLEENFTAEDPHKRQLIRSLCDVVKRSEERNAQRFKQ